MITLINFRLGFKRGLTMRREGRKENEGKFTEEWIDHPQNCGWIVFRHQSTKKLWIDHPQNKGKLNEHYGKVSHDH